MSMELGVAKFSLTILGDQYECSASLPDGSVPVSQLLPVIFAITDLVVGVQKDASLQDGDSISCRAGCGACCRQAVPVTRAETWFIAGLVASLDEDRRREIESRFNAALARLEESGLLAIFEGEDISDPDTVRNLSLHYFNLGIPCPFLEDESCSIHEARPLRCREYLVTSPAANCTNPFGLPLKPIPMPVRPSETLAYIGRGDESAPPAFMPLVLALKWVARQREREPTMPAPEILKNFLAALRQVAR